MKSEQSQNFNYLLDNAFKQHSHFFFLHYTYDVLPIGQCSDILSTRRYSLSFFLFKHYHDNIDHSYRRH